MVKKTIQIDWLILNLSGTASTAGNLSQNDRLMKRPMDKWFAQLLVVCCDMESETCLGKCRTSSRDIVDGSEILRSPVEVGSLSHCLHGFRHPRWLFGISSIDSTNVFLEEIFRYRFL